MKEIDIQVHEAQRVPNKMEAKRTTPRHIIIKMPKVGAGQWRNGYASDYRSEDPKMPKVKDKERILKGAR